MIPDRYWVPWLWKCVEKAKEGRRGVRLYREVLPSLAFFFFFFFFFNKGVIYVFKSSRVLKCMGERVGGGEIDRERYRFVCVCSLARVVFLYTANWHVERMGQRED